MWMESVRKFLEQQDMWLKNMEKQAKEDIKKAPGGFLRIARKNNTNQYYLVTEATDANGKYIRKKDMKLIRNLAQKDYAKKMLTYIEKGQMMLEKLLENTYEDKLFNVYEEMSESRKELINPYILNDEKYAEVWYENQMEKKLKKYSDVRRQDVKEGTEDVLTEIFTEKGEAVRSKSEKILADKFSLMDIPYVYEVPLYLNGYGYVRPDFKVLNKRTKKEYYWEHLGMLDDCDYVMKTVKKIELYEKNCLFLGESLILTYETSKHPLNMKNVELLINKYLV